MGTCPKCGHVADGQFCAECGTAMAATCPRCHAKLNPNARFCQDCGSPIPQSGERRASGPSVQTGEASIMKGTIDQSTHVDRSTHTTIGAQTNYHGAVQITQGSRNLSPEEWLQKGISALHARIYPQAIEAFTRYTSLQPHQADGHYYLALSSFQGNRPRLASLTTIRTVERYLLTATQNQPDCAHALVLWALIKEDYHVPNGMHHRPPTVDQLLDRAGPVTLIHLGEMIEHLPARGNKIWEWATRQHTK